MVPWGWVRVSLTDPKPNTVKVTIIENVDGERQQTKNYFTFANMKRICTRRLLLNLIDKEEKQIDCETIILYSFMFASYSIGKIERGGGEIK